MLLRKKRHQAFTLVELLVVIGIIAVLAAILFPVFAQARAKARQTACLSNMRQIGLALQQYVQDNEEDFPKGEFWDGNSPFTEYYFWSSQRCMLSYIKNTDIYRCPEDTFSATQTAAEYGLDADRVPVPISYMANAVTPGLNQSFLGVDNPQGLLTYGAAYGGSDAPTALAAVEAPSDMYLLVEGRVEFYGGLAGCAQWLNNEIDWCNVTGDVVTEATLDSLSPPDSANPAYRAWRRHSGSSNVLFADGHARSVHPSDMRDAKHWLINAPA